MSSSGRLYGVLFDHVAVRVDPERAHELAAALIGIAGAVPPIRWLLERTFGRHVGQGVDLFGRHLPGRVVAAAGFDKNASMTAGLAALGFSVVEVGTVTAHAQDGNPPPRLFRLVDRRALVNRMGFNNDGAAAVARRLHRLRATPAGRRLVVGANIGKSRVTPLEEAAQDYGASARRLAPYVDYLVVNVSSPNTPGLRDLQSVETLRPILERVRAEAKSAARRDVPVLVKISPDLADADVADIGRLVVELDLAGVVAVNTTIAHDEGTGGMSGPPLLARGLEVVALVRRELGPDRIVVGVGGISTPADAAAYLDAGADLVQAYTAFIYEGPAWPGRIDRALAAHVPARSGS